MTQITNTIRIAIDLTHEYHVACLLVPATATADYEAAAERADVELLFTGDAAAADDWHRGVDFDDRQDAYDRLYQHLDSRRIEARDWAAGAKGISYEDLPARLAADGIAASEVEYCAMLLGLSA